MNIIQSMLSASFRRTQFTSLVLFYILSGYGSSVFAQHSVPESIRGNWIDPENNVWYYSFTDKFAVADGQFWDYSSVKPSGKSVTITLKRGDTTLKLFAVGKDKNTLSIGRGKGDLKRYISKINSNPDYARHDAKGFSKPLIKSGIFRLTGWISDYRPDSGAYRFVKVIYNPLLRNEQKIHIASVDRLGRFSLSFPFTNPQEIMFQFGDRMVEFYAIPGSNLAVCINNKNTGEDNTDEHLSADESSKEMLFGGAEGLLNTEIYNFSLRREQILNFGMEDEKRKQLGQMEYKDFRMGKMHEQMELLKKYAGQHKNSLKFRQIQEAAIKYSAGDDLLRYSWLKSDTVLNLGEDYLAFLHEIPVDNDLAVLSHSYSSFLDEYKNFLERRNTGKESDNSLQDILTGEITEETEFYISSKFGKGTVHDIILARIADEKLSENGQLDDSDISFYKKNVTDREVLSEMSKDFSKAADIEVPENARLLSPLEKEADDVLSRLVKKYKEKVIYVDFWAPWCGPCMGEMPLSASLRKEFENKNVIFLYLGVNCSKESWEGTIKRNNIQGEHYLLNQEEFALLSNRFQISGIPRYMLVDKEGRVVNADAERPSSGMTIVKDINRLL